MQNNRMKNHPVSVPSLQFRAGIIVAEDILIRFFPQSTKARSPLAHADSMAITDAQKVEVAVFCFPDNEIGAAHF
jgi:tRNA(Arg) A34 adenosine deaminase TadA